MTPQIRITPNTSIRIDAVCSLPFIFNKNLHIDYTDTIRNINLSAYSIDSLLSEVEVVEKPVKTTDVTVVLHAENEIPVDIKAYMRCLDESGKIINDPEDASKPLILFEQDTVVLKAQPYIKNGGQWVPDAKGGETIITASMTKAKMDLMPSIKNIVYYARIDDQSLQEAYAKGLENIRITDDQGLTLKIGLTAHLDALLNFDQNNK